MNNTDNYYITCNRIMSIQIPTRTGCSRIEKHKTVDRHLPAMQQFVATPISKTMICPKYNDRGGLWRYINKLHRLTGYHKRVQGMTVSEQLAK